MLDKELNLLGAEGGGGIAEGTKNWSDAPATMDAARKANAQLPRLTAQVVKEAGETRSEIHGLYASLPGGSSRRYARAVDLALESLIDTEVAYSDVNSSLTEGFRNYETLYNRTEKFFMDKAKGRYEDNAKAAEVYSLATSALVDPLAAFRKGLSDLEAKAAKKGAKTSELFEKAGAAKPSG